MESYLKAESTYLTNAGILEISLFPQWGSYTLAKLVCARSSHKASQGVQVLTNRMMDLVFYMFVTGVREVSEL